jgi:hypothetical protein
MPISAQMLAMRLIIFRIASKKQVCVGRIQNFNASKKCVVLENLRVVLCEIVV